jgi:hypothetical protein
MADRFLREIRDMHQLRKDIRSLPPTSAEEFMKRLGNDAADDWVFRARDSQLPPHGAPPLRRVFRRPWEPPPLEPGRGRLRPPRGGCRSIPRWRRSAGRHSNDGGNASAPANSE